MPMMKVHTMDQGFRCMTAKTAELMIAAVQNPYRSRSPPKRVPRKSISSARGVTTTTNITARAMLPNWKYSIIIWLASSVSTKSLMISDKPYSKAIMARLYTSTAMRVFPPVPGTGLHFSLITSLQRIKYLHKKKIITVWPFRSHSERFIAWERPPSVSIKRNTINIPMTKDSPK